MFSKKVFNTKLKPISSLFYFPRMIHATVLKMVLLYCFLSFLFFTFLSLFNFRLTIVATRSDDDEANSTYLVPNYRSEKVTPKSLTPLYIITPTFPRALQIPELTRLGQTLKHVKNMTWIVAEDATKPTEQVLELLNQLEIRYQYLLTPMPQKYMPKPGKKKPKGVQNRMKGLEWIMNHVADSGDDSGVFYFADDDNTYDLRLFEEIRKTQRVSIFPVGLLNVMPVSTPILDLDGNLLDFYTGWKGQRKFPVDMAAFAVNLKHFIQVNSKKRVNMDYYHGYEEESFLRGLQVEPKDVEFLADNCTKIYVWHTRTMPPTLTGYEKLQTEQIKKTNMGKLLKYWCLFFKEECNITPDEKPWPTHVPLVITT